MFWEISANHVKTWLDLNFCTPVHVALLEGGDFISLSDYARRATEDVIAWRAHDSSNPPSYVPLHSGWGSGLSCMMLISANGSTRQNGSIKKPKAMLLTSRVGDRQPDILQMVGNRLVGHCQSDCAHTLCHGLLLAPSPHIVSQTLLLFCLSNQLEIRKSLCKVDPNLIQFLSLPLSDMPCYSRFECNSWNSMQLYVNIY